MNLNDTLSLAFRSLRANKLRSTITVSIIALGIMALIGIITAIEAMNLKLMESFSNLGANGFTIRFRERDLRIDQERNIQLTRKDVKQLKQSQLSKPISLREASLFKERFSYPSTISISAFAGNNNRLAFGKRKTSPSVAMFGTDENYVSLNGYSLHAGRNLNNAEVGRGAPFCVLGFDVAKKLFGVPVTAAINKLVKLNGYSFIVIGVLEPKGSIFGFSRDNIVLIPHKNLDRNFSHRSFVIGVKASEVTRVEQAIGEAEGYFRVVRKLLPTEESNFSIEKSNQLAERAINSLRYLTAAVVIIGLITLTGAAIGLMNIMLVAVAERTREIGLIKAIGGSKRSIHLQFLSEAILLSVFGAVIGIVLGIVAGNFFGQLLQVAFLIPWNWTIYGILICSLVGLAAGVYPAVKAGNLNPIDALRYE